MNERRAMPAGSFRSLHVSMDHRVKPGGDDVSECAVAARRVAIAWRYALFIRSLFVAPVESAHLDLAGVLNAGPMRTSVAAVGAYHANHGQRTGALLGCCAFGILRPSADAHERARCDDRRKSIELLMVMISLPLMSPKSSRKLT